MEHVGMVNTNLLGTIHVPKRMIFSVLIMALDPPPFLQYHVADLGLQVEIWVLGKKKYGQS